VVGTRRATVCVRHHLAETVDCHFTRVFVSLRTAEVAQTGERTRSKSIFLSWQLQLLQKFILRLASCERCESQKWPVSSGKRPFLPACQSAMGNCCGREQAFQGEGRTLGATPVVGAAPPATRANLPVGTHVSRGGRTLGNSTHDQAQNETPGAAAARAAEVR
jgi:hypothetical protein